MKVGSTERASSFDSAYHTAVVTVTESLSKTCGEGRMLELCTSLTQPLPLVPSTLDSISFGIRATAAAAVLESHLAPPTNLVPSVQRRAALLYVRI